MKRVLLATTALAATAGMAAAEIKWGGLGRFGIVYDSENKVEVKTPAVPAMYRTGLVPIDLEMAKEKVIKNTETTPEVIGLPSAAELSPLAADKKPKAADAEAQMKLDGSALPEGTKKIVKTIEVRGGRAYATAMYYDEAGKEIAKSKEPNVPLKVGTQSDGSDNDFKDLAGALFGIKDDNYDDDFKPMATDFVDGLMVTQTYTITGTKTTVMHEAKVPGMSLPAIPEVPAKVTKTEKRSVRIESRFRITLDASATADNGTVFSTRIRMQADDKADGEAETVSVSGARFSVKANGLTLDVGNAGGAIDGLPNYYGAYETGLTSFTGQYAGVDYGFQGFSSKGAGTNGVNLGWSSGPFSLAVSGRKTKADMMSKKITGSEIAAHIAYSAGGMAFALGHSTSSDMKQESMTVVTAKFQTGPVTFTLLAGDEDIKTMVDGNKEEKFSGSFYGAAVTFAASDAVTIGANYGTGDDKEDDTHYGLGMTYSLGGGVSLKGGVGQKDPGGTAKTVTMADLGVQFNF